MLKYKRTIINDLTKAYNSNLQIKWNTSPVDWAEGEVPPHPKVFIRLSNIWVQEFLPRVPFTPLSPFLSMLLFYRNGTNMKWGTQADAAIGGFPITKELFVRHVGSQFREDKLRLKLKNWPIGRFLNFSRHLDKRQLKSILFYFMTPNHSQPVLFELKQL